MTENSLVTVPPNASTARCGPEPVPSVSWTTTGTRPASDGVAACATVAIAGPATPAASRKEVATVAILRADRAGPPHVTPREKGTPAPLSSLTSITCTSMRCVEGLRDDFGTGTCGL